MLRFRVYLTNIINQQQTTLELKVKNYNEINTKVYQNFTPNWVITRIEGM